MEVQLSHCAVSIISSILIRRQTRGVQKNVDKLKHTESTVFEELDSYSFVLFVLSQAKGCLSVHLSVCPKLCCQGNVCKVKMEMEIHLQYLHTTHSTIVKVGHTL